MNENKASERLQADITAKLKSESALNTVNILSARKLLTSSEVPESVIWTTARGGKLGTGVLVGMPYTAGDRAQPGDNSTTLKVDIRCFELPDLAQSASGPQMTADEIAFICRNLLRGMVCEPLTALTTEGNSIVPEPVPKEHEGVLQAVLTVQCRLGASATNRVIVPTISEAALTVTLAAVTSGSSIYYTTDGTFPGPGNSAATLYSAPFAVVSGTEVRFAAYKNGLSGSVAASRIITS